MADKKKVQDEFSDKQLKSGLDALGWKDNEYNRENIAKGLKDLGSKGKKGG